MRAPVDIVFHALADANRRLMLDRLAGGPASVSELAKPLAISLPAVVQHLQVLEAAGIVKKCAGRGQYRRRRERRPMAGMLVHLDGSTHSWIAGVEKQDLVVAMDDAVTVAWRLTGFASKVPR